MKRVYKFWVYEDECESLPKYLTLASEVIDDGSNLSKICNGHMHFGKDGSVDIFDNELGIIPEETSEDWKTFFEMTNTCIMTVIKSIQGYELHLKRFDKE